MSWLVLNSSSKRHCLKPDGMPLWAHKCGAGGGGREGVGLASSAPMSAPHRLDIFKHGHRAVCSGVLIGSFLDILEIGAGF